MIKHRIDRRRFLRGVGGLSLGLPLLDVMARPATGRAAAGDKPVFVTFMVNSCGVVQQDKGGGDLFWPSKTGAITRASLDADANRATSELKDHADKLLLVKGVRCKFYDFGCAHAEGGAQVLTAAGIVGKGKGLRADGPSIDNVIAKAVNADGRESLLLYAGRKGTYIDDYVSYRGSKQLRSGENNPWNAYQQLVGMAGTPMGTVAADGVALRRTSVNDLVRAEMKELLGRKDLSTEDRARLDLHFSSIRDLETKMVAQLDPGSSTAFKEIDGEHARDANIVKCTRLQIDIMVLALAMGQTRVAVLQVGGGADRTVYPIEGIPRGATLHMISHRLFGDGQTGKAIPNARELHHKVDRLNMQNFKYLLDRLAATKTPDGTLLDLGIHSWTNELADGPGHSKESVPFVCAGGARGALKTGVFVDAGGAYNNKILATFATAAGLRAPDGSPFVDFGEPGLPRGLLASIMR